MLRFHTPLIEPDGRISRIRLSEKVSRFHPQKAARPRICRAISEETGRNKTLLEQETVIETLNRMMVNRSSDAL